MTRTAAAPVETHQFMVGFEEVARQSQGIAAAAADQLNIDLRFESADRIIATKPPQAPPPPPRRAPSPSYAFAVEPHLKWLIDTVISEMVGFYPSPFAIELRYPQPGDETGYAAVVRLDHPEAPAYSLSGTVVTEQLKEAVVALYPKGLNLVAMLAGLHQRYLDGDYGDANPDTVARNQANRAANSGEVTGIYLSTSLPEPSIAISQHLPYEKGAILMLGPEYKAIQY